MFQRFSFIKQPAHRIFDYQPRYYDERKERIQRRMEEEKIKLNNEAPDAKTLERRISFRDQMTDKWSSDYRSQARRSNIRLIVVLGVLLAVFYVLFTQVDQLSHWFS